MENKLIAALAKTLAGQGNSQARGGDHNKGKEPSGIITLSLGEQDRLEARYWENPVKETGLTSIGYTKPRVAETSKGRKEYKSFRLTQALVDMEATYRVCERALERDSSKLISLTDDDRNAAKQVVSIFADCFTGAASEATGHGGLVNGQADIANLLQALVNRA